MARQSSDFRQGVEAAAKWLREDALRNVGASAIDDQCILARRMLAAVGDDPEGTETRTVAQIVQYIRECAMVGNVNAVKVAIERVADNVEQFDWKRR